MSRKTFNDIFKLGLLLLLINFTANNKAFSAQYFISPSKQVNMGGMSALGIGYYDEPVVYYYKDSSKDNILSHYKGFFIKFEYNLSDNLAFHGQYLRAQGADQLWGAGGSLLYGFNLGRPGPGLYAGIAYTLKSRQYLAGEQFMQNEKRWGLDYPIGIQVKNSQYTFSIETRYRHFMLDSGEVGIKKSSYPLYIGILMNF